MGFEFDFSELEELQKKIDHAAKKAQELEGENTVPFDDCFSPSFMQHHTSFNNIDDFLSAAGIDPSSQASFDNFPENELDRFVKDNSSFSSWEDMLSEALEKWTFDQLGF